MKFMKLVTFALALIAIPAALISQPTLATIVGPIYNIDGSRFTGCMVVTRDSDATSNGVAVLSGSIAATAVNGSISAINGSPKGFIPLVLGGYTVYRYRTLAGAPCTIKQSGEPSQSFLSIATATTQTFADVLTSVSPTPTLRVLTSQLPLCPNGQSYVAMNGVMGCGAVSAGMGGSVTGATWGGSGGISAGTWGGQ